MVSRQARLPLVSAAWPIAASAVFSSSRPARITFMSGARLKPAPVYAGRGLLIDDALGHLFVERPHRPVHPAQAGAARRIVCGRQRMVGIMMFQVIQDRPHAFGAGAIHVDEHRHGLPGIVGHGRIAGHPLFRHHQAGQAAGRATASGESDGAWQAFLSDASI